VTALSCPVCGEPQADPVHLADHLAFVALLDEEDHRAWLEEHAPGWAESGTEELAAQVAEKVPEADVEVDTTEPEPHDHGQEHGHHGADGRESAENPDLDPETRDVIEEARRLTREMRGETDSDE
jgi:hypothetical protein